MYILLISRGIPSVKDPQWGCFEFDQAKALKKLGHKVVVISVDVRFRFYYRKIGITYFCKEGIDCFNNFLLPEKIVSLFCGRYLSEKIRKKQYEKMYKIVVAQFGKPDIIYSHYLPISFFSNDLSLKYHIPQIAIEHWSALKTRINDSYVQYLAKRTYCNVSKVIAVSESLRQIIFENFGVDSIVVNNMVSDDFFYKQDNKCCNDGKIRFVSIGSLIKIKGYDILLSALSKVIGVYNNWELLIVGDGEEKYNLQKQINKLSLVNNVFLVGKKTKKEIVDIFLNSDLFILASRSETFGVVYIEAMMMGLPVIATACGGPEEFVQKTDGLVIPIEDEDALVNAILYMFKNYQLYDRVDIMENCKKRFSSSVIAQKLTLIFEDVVKTYKIKK